MMVLLPLLALSLQGGAPQDTSPPIEVIAPGKANAQTPATLVVEPAAMFIAACDDDHDGRTTRGELDACVARTFATAEGAKGGSIGYLAYGDWALRWLGDRTALPSPYEIDRDGDDRITLGELQLQFSRLFSRYDRDGDRAVTRAEALTIRAIAADAKGPARPAPPPGKRAKPQSERIPGGQPTEPIPTPIPQ